MELTFSEGLKQDSIVTWDKILNHKFVIEISKEILSSRKFAFYLIQDRLFLRTFSNILKGASSIPQNAEEKLLIKSLNNGIADEMRMQNEILDELSCEGIENTRISVHSITHDYAFYLRKVYHSRDMVLIVSALAPCPWTYSEIANSLSSNNIRSSVFEKWLGFYSSKESLNQVNQIKTLLNKMALRADEKKKFKMKHYFSISCDYELQFWNVAYSYQE